MAADDNKGPADTDQGWGVEQWTGDHTVIQGLWPGEKIPINEHQHTAPCGGYFNHEHENGSTAHNHFHKKCGYCERQ